MGAKSHRGRRRYRCRRWPRFTGRAYAARSTRDLTRWAQTTPPRRPPRPPRRSAPPQVPAPRRPPRPPRRSAPPQVPAPRRPPRPPRRSAPPPVPPPRRPPRPPRRSQRPAPPPRSPYQAPPALPRPAPGTQTSLLSHLLSSRSGGLGAPAARAARRRDLSWRESLRPSPPLLARPRSRVPTPTLGRWPRVAATGAGDAPLPGKDRFDLPGETINRRLPSRPARTAIASGSSKRPVPQPRDKADATAGRVDAEPPAAPKQAPKPGTAARRRARLGKHLRSFSSIDVLLSRGVSTRCWPPPALDDYFSLWRSPAYSRGVEIARLAADPRPAGGAAAGAR